jgi:hypothetical protein
MSAPAANVAARQAQDYLAAVELELADLPVDDRSALLEDLSLHLEAMAAEDDDRPLAVRLGQPSSYAAELRAAAGLPARGASPGSGGLDLRARLDAVLASAAYRRAAPALRGTGRLLAELRPAWWVLRGYLVVLVPCMLGRDYAEDFPVPAPMGSHLLGLLLVAAAVAGSVVLGRRALPKALRVVVVAAGVLLVLAGATVVNEVRNDLRADLYADAWASTPQVPDETYPLLSRYGPVTDVFPYAADGTPLDGVLLYDQDGRPLHVGFQQWWADQCARVLDQPKAADGVPVPNSYPQSYVLDPAGVDLSRSIPRPPSSCETEVARPAVPLPTFPARDGTVAESVAPDPGD